MKQFAKRRAKILELRQEGLSMSEIARLYGVTGERIRQIIRQAI
jgi:DNA-directed RNA polymerase sigma subunit (sigma70/sigma32)